jgi:hypothetical protein
VILGEFDLVPIAQALHRLMVGTEAPFILSDWRRENTPASVRGAGNQRIGALALQDARQLRRAHGRQCQRTMRLWRPAHRRQRLGVVLDEPTELPDGTAVELVSIDDVVASGGYLMDDETRAVFARELEASFDEEEAGQLIDAADVLADLRARRSDQ